MANINPSFTASVLLLGKTVFVDINLRRYNMYVQFTLMPESFDLAIFVLADRQTDCFTPGACARGSYLALPIDDLYLPYHV